MIHASIQDMSDRTVCRTWMRAPPVVGEFIWVTGVQRDFAVENFGTSSFKVLQVAHWVNPDYSPGTHTGEPIHTICVYVEPVGE